MQLKDKIRIVLFYFEFTITGCKKMEIIQSALRKQLESGTIPLYGKNHNNGANGVQMDWENIIRQHIKGL